MPCKHEDLRTTEPHTNLGGVACVYNLRDGEMGKPLGPTCLHYVAKCQAKKKPCLKQKVEGVRRQILEIVRCYLYT